MKYVDESLDKAETVAILGHIRPDGDSVGAALGMYNYLRDNYPKIKAQVFLHDFSEDFKSQLPGAEKVIVYRENGTDLKEKEVFDLCIALDASLKERLGHFEKLFDNAKKTVCIDHHATNLGFADVNVIDADVSSASELLYTLMKPDRVSARTADCIFTGIVHDTGCFCHDNTTEQTMKIASELIGRGARSGELIRETFTHRTFVQIRLIGIAMKKAELAICDKCIISLMTLKEIAGEGGTAIDVEPIIDELRAAAGTSCAVFARQTTGAEWRVSLRANGDFNVCKIAEEFGGGGHIKAAGCTLYGTEAEVKKQLLDAVEKVFCEAV